METHIRDAHQCGRDMESDGLRRTSNPYIIRGPEQDAWFKGYDESENDGFATRNADEMQSTLD